MELTKEDILKYGTQEEVKYLTEMAGDVIFLKSGYFYNLCLFYQLIKRTLSAQPTEFIERFHRIIFYYQV